MNIIINGQKLEFDKETSIQMFLDTKNISPDSVVVELNQIIVPTEKYHTTWLHNNDKVEILRFVGGG
jgi:sulfur carrier protein